MKILVTDYAWKDLEIEHEILRKVKATLIVAKTGVEDELMGLASQADGILTNWKSVTQNVIANAAKCKAIARYGIGLDNIDIQYATKMGIVVTNVPDYCLEEVSDHAIALLLSLARKIAFYDRAIKSGKYDLRAGTPLFRIRGKTLGIVGFGKIGKLVYRKAKAFGLNVIVFNRQSGHNSNLQIKAVRVSFIELLQHSDYISIHLPLTPETRHIFNIEAFRRMKPTAFIINSSRGDVVDPSALLEALECGLIAGAGLDVLSEEPPEPGDPLVSHPKVVVTPHAAFNSEESVEELRRTAATQMADVLSGKVPNFVVNTKVFEQPNLRVTLSAKPFSSHGGQSR